MSAQSESFDVAVVGGGAIGLACAWRARAARRARRRARRRRARRVARRRRHARAGLRGRVRRARAAASSGLESARRYADVLRRARRPRLPRRSARWSSRATATRPRRSTAWPRSARGLGLPVERLRPSQARRLEPALAPTVRLALDIDGRPLGRPAQARRRAARAFGGELRRARVTGLRVDGERVTGVTLDGRRRSPPDAGRRRRRRATSRSSTCPSTRACPVRPVKGQVLRLRDPRRPRPRRAHDPRRARLPRPARRRPLRARRDDGGARLGHDADRRRRLRAAARPVASSCPASSSSRSRS